MNLTLWTPYVYLHFSSSRVRCKEKHVGVGVAGVLTVPWSQGGRGLGRGWLSGGKELENLLRAWKAAQQSKPASSVPLRCEEERKHWAQCCRIGGERGRAGVQDSRWDSPLGRVRGKGCDTKACLQPPGPLCVGSPGDSPCAPAQSHSISRTSTWLSASWWEVFLVCAESSQEVQE